MLNITFIKSKDKYIISMVDHLVRIVKIQISIFGIHICVIKIGLYLTTEDDESKPIFFGALQFGRYSNSKRPDG